MWGNRILNSKQLSCKRKRRSLDNNTSPNRLVALFMAESAEDTRSLEGLLLRIITQATADNAEINLDLAEKALGHMVEEKRAISTQTM